MKIKNSFAFFYHWHQRLGLTMCLAVMAWALSGLAHPIISRLNPKPLAPPPTQALDIQHLGDLSHLTQQLNINQVYQLRLFQWQNQPVYRVHSNQGIQFFSAKDLQLLPLKEEDYAEDLARHFIGDNETPVIDRHTLSTFNEDYLYINRFLPVVKITFARADQVRVYIDTAQGRLATINDRSKDFTSAFFRNLHSWVWIENLILRKTLMATFLVLGFITALFGLWVYSKSWRLGIFSKTGSGNQHHPASRRLHRHLGALVSLFAMAFCFSGLLHLFMTEKNNEPQLRLQPPISTADLQLRQEFFQQLPDSSSIEDIQLVTLSNLAYWRIKLLMQQTQRGEHEHHQDPATTANTDVFYLDAQNGQLLEDGENQHAIYLAAVLGDLPVGKIQRIERRNNFGGEYGFINKRLPVQAVHFDLPGQPTLYIETSSNTLANRVDNMKRLEGYSFAYLHKWHFADGLGKNLRDLLTSFIALLIFLTLVLGIYRFICNR